MEVITTIYKIVDIDDLKILMPQRIITGNEENNVIKSGDKEYVHISKTKYEDGEECYYISVNIKEINKKEEHTKEELAQAMYETVSSKVIFIIDGEVKEMDIDDFENEYNLSVDYDEHTVTKAKDMTIKEVVENVETKIMFQSYAIKRIVSTIINNNYFENTRNIVLLGPTGVGKSKLIDLIANELQSPYAKIEGYNGDSLTSAYLTLFLNGKENKLSGPPIIFIDGINKGIEKIGKVDGDILVECMSKIITKKFKFPIQLTDNQTILFDPSNINYIIALDLEKEIELPNIVGIGKNDVEVKKNTISRLRELLVDANCEIIDLNKLDENNLKEILKKSSISPTNEYKKILEVQGTDLKISKKAYELMAHEAYKLNKGAKGLGIITDCVMRDEVISAQVDGKDAIYINEAKVLKKINNKLY